MAHERKETRYGKSFVAVAQHFKVDGVLVVDVGEEGDGCVDGDHEEDADDAGGKKLILVWNCVVRWRWEGIKAYCVCSHGRRKCEAWRKINRMDIRTAMSPNVAEIMRPMW